jgi:hypothetical protein
MLTEGAHEAFKEAQRRLAERERAERLYLVYERALIRIAEGCDNPVEFAIKTLMGAAS